MKYSQSINFQRTKNIIYPYRMQIRIRLESSNKKLNGISSDNTSYIAIAYLQKEISKLEKKQLAESIIMIRKIKTPLPFSSKFQSNQYELLFDNSYNIHPLNINLEEINEFNKYREGMHTVPLYDANQAKAIQIQAIKRKNSRLLNGEDTEIKQINNLFDEDIIGRDIDFNKYGFCHHCKQIKHISTLIRCQELNKENIPVKDTIVKKKQGQRSPIQTKKDKYYYDTDNFVEEEQGECQRQFCLICMILNYDADLKELNNLSKSSSWKCPYCEVITSYFYIENLYIAFLLLQ